MSNSARQTCAKEKRHRFARLCLAFEDGVRIVDAWCMVDAQVDCCVWDHWHLCARRGGVPKGQGPKGELCALRVCEAQASRRRK
jgi:hypothetical protein